MVESCLLCAATRADGVALHKFPENNAGGRRQRWLDFVEANGINLRDVLRSSVLCLRHFIPEDYTRAVHRRRLTNAVVPSIVGVVAPVAEEEVEEEVVGLADLINVLPVVAGRPAPVEDEVELRPPVDREVGIQNPLPASHNIGAMNFICQHCQARHFLPERVRAGHFSTCCRNGVVALDDDRTLRQPPGSLMALLIDDSAKGRHFRGEIRQYNNVSAFASFTVSAQAHNANPHQRQQLVGPGPRVFTVFGQMYHQYNHVIPADGSASRYC
ncbi:uncharacterized protein LOC126845266 isoform X3 [Adelges cooleyi]|uniref:uncharacterized protein LOC126845266 isoform X3 n=1 Tax=Adelges cooleyi TaxID=133065 RepID=UPI00217F582F|nr:uncharacterized protein LOC126845266 isoform X3 [Adelges cooleyi]